LCARLDSDDVQRGHENVYWFGQNVPTSSDERLVLLALGFVVEVTNSRERGSTPRSLRIECVFPLGQGRILVILRYPAWSALFPLL
jgi:hypothetical protein